MEFLRFGSSIPGSYWGCCAVCIIQNFKVKPDDKASIQLVGGDGGNPVFKDGEPLFFGGTWKDIFLQRLRIGTFSSKAMPNHGFIAVLTDSQIRNEPGKSWLKILKEQGFEFLRTVDNSVYSGSGVPDAFDTSSDSINKNHLFGLFRNIGTRSVNDPFTPPSAWTELESVILEPWKQDLTNPSDNIKLSEEIYKVQKELYDSLPPQEFYTEEELEKLKIPVIYAGKRSKFPQQSKEQRKIAEQASAKPAKKVSAPFSTSLA